MTRGRIRDAGVLVVALATFALVLVGLSTLGVPTCPTRVLFGVPCPGCGLTRATLALARGDFVAALRFHPLSPLVLPLLAYALSAAVWRRLRPTSRAPEPSGRACALLAIALVVLWGIRLGGGLGGLPDPIAPERGLLTSHAFAR